MNKFFKNCLIISGVILASTFSMKAQTGTDLIPGDYRADEQKPTLVMFTASWCAPCSYAKNVIFKNEGVVLKLKNFNVLYFDVDTSTGKKFRSSYGCDKDGVPTFLLLDNEMKVITKKVGISSKPVEFINFLNKAL